MKVSLEKPGTPEELMHVGVRGMKWGIRKERKITNVGSNAKARKVISKEMHNNNAPSITKTRVWEQWAKLAQKNVDYYNKSKTHRIGSNAAAGLLLVIGGITVKNFSRIRG